MTQPPASERDGPQWARPATSGNPPSGTASPRGGDAGVPPTRVAPTVQLPPRPSQSPAPNAPQPTPQPAPVLAGGGQPAGASASQRALEPAQQSVPIQEQVQGPVLGGATTLAAMGVSRWFGQVVAVSEVSFAVGPGITGLLGPNGAGKTTLLRMLSGLLAPSRGDVRVLGQPVRGNSEIFRQITLIMDRDAVYTFLSAREFVRMNAHLQGIRDEGRIASVLEMVELSDAADRPMGGYSKGMRQRARLAAGLVHDPSILLLDEPFSGADPRQRMSLMNLVRRLAAEGRTILFSSHILEEVEQLAHDVLVITHGKLAAAGDVRALRQAMTDRPHRIRIRCADPRRLASWLLTDPVVTGIEVHDDGQISVQARELGACALVLPRIAQAAAVRLYEVAPEDESLERVFAYLVGS